MGGSKALSRVQFGQETTGGTAVPANTLWRGPFVGIKDGRETEPVEEDLGIALKSSRKLNASLIAELSFPVTNLTPEQVFHIFEAGIKQVNTGVADGIGSSGYTHTYPFGITTINDVSSYTIESGDDVQAEEAEFCVVKSFVISAVAGKAVQISSEWFGRQVTAAAFTGGVSAPSVSEIHASSGKLYIDDITNAFGTTQVNSGNLLEATITVNTGRVPLFTADSGALYFIGEYFNIDEFSVEIEMVFVHTADAEGEKTKWRDNVNRHIRIEFTGDDYATAGTGTLLNGKKGIQIDIPCSYDEFSAIEHKDGQSIITATASGGYINESGEGLTLVVCNEFSPVI